MRVLLSTFGSRGDVQPLVALAVRLQEMGVEARVCAPPDEEFADLLERAGVPLAPAFTPMRRWYAAMAGQPAQDLPRRAAEVMAAQFDAIGAAAEGCDAVVATGLFPSVAAAQSVAEQRGIPYVYATFCSLFLPSPHRRPFAYPGHPHPPGMTDNRALWRRDIQTMNALFGEAVNGHRASVGLARVDNVRDHVYGAEPWLATDPTLDPLPADLDAVQTGAWLTPDERPLPDQLLAFLRAGTPPVYVGFGSMPLQDAVETARVSIAAIRAHGRRAVVAHGWAGLAPVEGHADCFAIGEVNQQALFRRVAAVVHHGGAGTTTTAARAGVPQVVVPQIVDQPYWAGRVAGLGIGVAHDGPSPTLASLTGALERAMSLETCARAVGVAGMVGADGAVSAANRLLQMMAREGAPTPA